MQRVDIIFLRLSLIGCLCCYVFITCKILRSELVMIAVIEGNVN